MEGGRFFSFGRFLHDEGNLPSVNGSEEIDSVSLRKTCHIPISSAFFTYA